MEDKENRMNEGMKNVPRNPNQQITDDEINQLLKAAASQIAEKEQNAKDFKSEKERQEERNLEEKKAEEERKLEEQKRVEEAKKQEEQRRVAEAKKSEEQRKAEEAKKLEQQRRAEQRKRLEEQKKVEEAKKREEQQKEEQRKLQEEQRKAEEARKLEEQRRSEAKRLEEKRLAEKGLEEKRKAEEAECRARENAILEEENVIVTPPQNPYKEKMTFGRFVGIVLETIWTLVKLTVGVTVVTAVVGFLLVQNMMVRGRGGERESLPDNVVSASTTSKQQAVDEQVEKWLEDVDREKLTMESDDGNILVARRIVTKEDGKKWAVIMHGYNGSMEDIYDIAMHYEEKGYNILMPDLRGNGESEGSVSGMGWLDRYDVINWLDLILKETQDAEIVLHGVDIGADTALMMLGEPLKGGVKAVVAEGAYTSAWDIMKVEYKARYERLPVFPLMNMMNPVLKVWQGYSLKEADAVKQVKNSSVPVLLIWGLKDTYVSETMTDKLDGAIASYHEVYKVAGATHEDCRLVDETGYYDRTFQFLEQYIK